MSTTKVRDESGNPGDAYTGHSLARGPTGAADITMWDARDENVRVVREFLRAVDSAAVRR